MTPYTEIKDGLVEHPEAFGEHILSSNIASTQEFLLFQLCWAGQALARFQASWSLVIFPSIPIHFLKANVTLTLLKKNKYAWRLQRVKCYNTKHKSLKFQTPSSSSQIQRAEKTKSSKNILNTTDILQAFKNME